MKGPYSELADRIRLQIPDLDRLVERVLASWARAKEQSDDQQLFGCGSFRTTMSSGFSVMFLTFHRKVAFI